MKTEKLIAGPALFAALGLLLSGCGGGGASQTPSVTARPKQASHTGGNGKATKTDGGNGTRTPAGDTGSFKGIIKLTGTAPELPAKVRKGDMSAKDAEVCAKHGVPDESVIVGSGGGVKNVFVYVTRSPSSVDLKSISGAVPKDPVVFDQQGCMFIPHCLTVRCGRELRLLNGDGVSHNTHTNPLNNPAYNKSLAPGDRKGDAYGYPDPEVLPVKVVCDIHTWMRAYHLPLNHRFMALTNDKGEFEINGLPKGRYTFRIWHEAAGYLEREFQIAIRPGKPTEKNFSYEAGRFTAFHGPPSRIVKVSSLR